MVHKNAETVNKSFARCDAGHTVYGLGISRGLQPGRQRMRGILADHGGPLADLPARHQAARDIGVGPGESLDHRFGGRGKEQNRPIHRIREGTTQLQFPAGYGFPGIFHVRTAELGAAFENVRDVCI